jgi:hypothetical protein
MKFHPARFWVADKAAFGPRVRSKLLVLENKTGDA